MIQVPVIHSSWGSSATAFPNFPYKDMKKYLCISTGPPPGWFSNIDYWVWILWIGNRRLQESGRSLRGPGVPEQPHLRPLPTPPIGPGPSFKLSPGPPGLAKAVKEDSWPLILLGSCLAECLVQLDSDMRIVLLVGFWTCIVAASLSCDLHSWLKLAVVLGPALLAVLRYGGTGSWVVSSGTVLLLLVGASTTSM